MRPRALLVDDEVLLLMLASDLLASIGCAVVALGDGADALDSIRRGPVFDLAVINLGLPNISGYTLVEELTRRWPSTPVLISTGYATSSVLHTTGLSLAGGRFEILQKPWSDEDFLKAARRMLPSRTSRV